MTHATIRAAVEHAVRQGHLLPHQLAALTAHDQRLTDSQRQAFTDDWRAAGSPAAPSQPAQPAGGIRLSVPYFSQNDNASGTGFRECFSSSCAMVAAALGLIQSDDAYNRLRARHGDTTNAEAQIATLRDLGLSARLITNANAAWLEQQLRAGRPVAVGWLHKGPVSRPTGGGHWSVVIGFTADGWIHHDPNGEANLVAGGYVNHTNGKGIIYSRQNWGRRWEADGPRSGWAMDIKPMG
jgi:hypothetical protein